MTDPSSVRREDDAIAAAPSPSKTPVAVPARPDPLAAPAAGPLPGRRLEIVDKLRGLVIVLMVLDHVRHFMHAYSQRASTMDLAQTDALIFATRWITHLCAPTFVFLAGVSIYLQRAGGKRGWPLARFLLTRGVWLIVLEITVVGFAFNFAEPFLFLQVIWAIGVSMILMATLAWAPPLLVLGIGLAILLGHDALVLVKGEDLGVLRPLWTLLMTRGTIGYFPGYVAYPPLPWFGIMAIGYGLGGLFAMAPERRDRSLVAIGLSALAVFAVLRGFNLYGDVLPWAPQRDATTTVLSFLKVSKYPPSLHYTLVTLGLALTLAPLLARLRGPAGHLLLAFGRTPLFVYVLHLYLAHALALAVGVAMGFPAAIFLDSMVQDHRLVEAGWGVDLFWTYVAWIAVVLALWAPAAWFAGVKSRRRDWWLGYL